MYMLFDINWILCSSPAEDCIGLQAVSQKVMLSAGRGLQHGLQANQGEVQAQCQGCASVRGEWSGPGSGSAQGDEGPGEASW